MESVTVTLLAAGAAEEAAHGNPLIPATNELIWGAVCFFILLAIMSKKVFPSVKRTLQERTQNIEGKLEQAERDRAAAADLRRQYEAKLEEAHAEAQRIVDQARTNGDRLETELRGQAEEQARRIVERAQETIAGERDRALAGLQTQVGTLAVDLAQKIVGNSLDRDRQLGLVDQYIQELQSS